MRPALGPRILQVALFVTCAAGASHRAESTVSLAPNSASLFPTQSVSVTATITSTFALPLGFHPLTFAGVPSGVTLVPASPGYTVPPSATGIFTAITTFQFSVGASVFAGGPFSITVRDNVTSTQATFTLTIREPLLHPSITTPSITLRASPINVFVRVAADPGFGRNVGAGGVPFLFSVDALPPSAPANVTAGGTKSEVAPYSNTLTFPFSRTGPVTPGAYIVPVVATWTGTTGLQQTASANLSLNIPDIAVTPPASSATVCNGGLVVSTNSYALTPQYNYAGTPSLTVLSAPSGVTVTPPVPAAMPPGQNVTFGLQAAGAAAGSTIATARLLDATNVVDKNIAVAFQVINPDITASASPASLPLQAGGAAQNFSVTATGPPRICNSTPIVDVTVLGLPAGFTFPATTTLNPPAYGPANLPVSAGAGVAPGSYPATLRFTPRNGAAARNVPVTLTVTSGPDFTLGANPTSLSLQPGASGTIDFSESPLNGFTGTVNVTIPAIQSVTVSPSTFSLTAAGARTVTFQASASALPGTYTATVSGTALGVPGPRTVNISIVILAPPDFAVAPAPTSVSMQPGGNGRITFTVTPLNGWNFPVVITVPAIPNFTANPTSATIPGTGGSVDVVFTASASAPVGSTPVTITGANAPGLGPPRSHSVNVTLVVQPPPDYALAVNPVSLRLTAGDSGSVVVSVTPLNGFTGSVHVTASSIPNVTFTPAVFDVSPGAGQTVQVATTAATTPGTSTATFTGTSPGIPTPHAASFSLTIDAIGDFTLHDVPATLTLAAGGTGQTAVFFQGTNGFLGPVAVTAPTIPGATFNPARFTLAAGAVQVVDVAVAASAPAGSAADNFTGTGPGVTGTRLARFALTVTTGPDYQLVASPSTVQIPPGGAGGTSVSLLSLNGYAGSVTVTAVPPSGITVTPATFVLGGATPQAVTIGAAAGLTGSYDVVFNGVDASARARSTAVRLTVAVPDFRLSVSPSSLRLSTGTSAPVVLTAQPLNGFTGTVNVASVLPSGLTSDSPAFTLSPGESRTVTITAASTAAPGLVTVAWNGTANGVTGTRSALLPVSVDTSPDFTLTVTPTAINLLAGGQAPAQVTLVPINGWSTPVDVVVTGSTGVSVVPSSFTLLPNSPQPVVIHAADDAPAGAVTLLFQASGTAAGTGISVTRIVNVQVSVGLADFNVRVTPASPQVVAGRTANLTFTLDPLGAFAGTASITPLNLPPGATFTPAQPLLAPNVPQAATLAIPRTTPPGPYALIFRADETPGSNLRGRRPFLISKTITVPLLVLAPTGGFTVIAVPPAVLASPGQPVAVRYEFRNLGDETLLITGDTFVRRDRNGVVYDTTEETVGLTLPPRGVASASNTVLATGEQFAKAGSPAIVFEDRTFRASPDSTGFAAFATAPVAVTAANSLLATASVTRVSVVYPPSGTLVGRGDNLRAQGVIFGSGTGTLLVGWLYDGILAETATVPLQNGAPTSVTNSVSLPTLLAGNHEISLAILAPNTLASPSVQIYVDEALTALHLVTPTAGSAFVPAFSPPTFSWIPAPGIARYGVGLRRRGAPGGRYRWAFTSETQWGPPASLWNELPEGEYEWVVRGFTASGRSLLDRQSGGATAPPTSEGTLDVADGWTVTSAGGRFSIGAQAAALGDLAGQASRAEGGVHFAWKDMAGALYVHALYLDSPEGPRRIRIEVLPKAGLLLPAASLPPGGALLWRVTAVDRDGRPLGATALAPVPGGAR